MTEGRLDLVTVRPPPGPVPEEVLGGLTALARLIAEEIRLAEEVEIPSFVHAVEDD